METQDVMHPSDEVLAISISNHYDPEDSAQGNLSLYNKNEDVMLSYAYEFGRNEGIFAMTIKFETGEVDNFLLHGISEILECHIQTCRHLIMKKMPLE